MNDVGELKQFAAVHAGALNIHDSPELLARIRTDDEGAPSSWAWEWGQAADTQLREGHLLSACQHYILARFPYVDGPTRQEASTRSVHAFDRWRQAETDIQPLDVSLPGGRVRCWTSGLSAARPLPLLLVMGGIISVKEQWAPILAQAERLGMAGVVTEMPGVGENTLRYGAESWRMVSGVLDAVGDRADVAHTYAIALSFSGHLALRCAITDSRIRGVVTAGTPVSDFFTDATWQHNLPRITVDTLAHLTGVKPADLADHMRGWALTADELGALDIPVCCLASLRDEIIPGGDVRRLRDHVRDLRLVENDDVHGSPHHLAESQRWVISSTLHMRGLPTADRLAGGTT
jgi:hypothetical protein